MTGTELTTVVGEKKQRWDGGRAAPRAEGRLIEIAIERELSLTSGLRGATVDSKQLPSVTTDLWPSPPLEVLGPPFVRPVIGILFFPRSPPYWGLGRPRCVPLAWTVAPVVRAGSYDALLSRMRKVRPAPVPRPGMALLQPQFRHNATPALRAPCGPRPCALPGLGPGRP